MTIERIERELAKVQNTTAKILTIDIERLPGVAYVWEPKTRYVAPRNFVKWPSLLCFAARWYGQKRPIFSATWDDHDAMVRKAWELYDEADVVVTYNGVRFDNKHLRSDWLLAGLTPPRPWKDIDLFAQVKQFGFESKSLDSVSRRLGRPGKQLHYDIDLAQRAAAGDRAAQREMRSYNIGDIELTEWLYDRLRGWLVTGHIAKGQTDGKTCPNCGGNDLTLRKTTYRAIIIDYALFTCGNCGKHSRGGWQSRASEVMGVKS
jgi:hypothetical protein